MKEAFGGIINIVFVVVFLVVVMGVLGLVVSYTKAFRMKDAIISVIEEYEGSGCYPEFSSGSMSSQCREEIENKAKEIGYRPVSLNCPTDSYGGDSEYGFSEFYAIDGLYCYSMYKKSDGQAVFRVITQVDMNFPIIEKIMGFRFFQVAGDTKTIQLQYGD